MANHKVKRGGRKTARGHRHSTSAKILPPLDVRSNGMMNEFAKRIMKGPLTIVMVYADWCGHCHHMMPHFDAAAKSANRSVQAVKLNETMLNMANSTINKSVNQSAKPMSVEGYPSILLVDQQGNKVTEIEAVKNTNTMTKVMNESGSLARNAGIASMNSSMNQSMNTSSNRPALSMVTRNESPDEIVNNIIENEVIRPEMNVDNRTNRSNRRTMIGIEENGMASRPFGTSLGDVDTFSAVSPMEEENMLTTPPTGNDLHSIQNKLSEEKKVGGSLYEAMSRSAYVLAPTAALLATSALMMKRRTRKRSKKSKRSKK